METLNNLSKNDLINIIAAMFDAKGDKFYCKQDGLTVKECVVLNNVGKACVDNADGEIDKLYSKI